MAVENPSQTALKVWLGFGKGYQYISKPFISKEKSMTIYCWAIKMRFVFNNYFYQ